MMHIDTPLTNINFAQIVPKIELKNFSFKLGIGIRINKENYYESELGHIWESKAEANEVYWSQKRDGNYLNEIGGVFDDNFGEVEERNNKIMKIRDKYLILTKVGRSSYEKIGDYFYKSRESYKQFLAEVQSEGLVKSIVDKMEFHLFKEWDKFEVDTEDQGDFYR